MMKLLISSITSLLIFILYSGSAPLYRSKYWDSVKEDKLNNFISAVMKCRNNAGMFVALVKDGKVTFTSGYGHRDLQNDLPVTSTTRFNIGSLSKAFTTALAADALSKNSTVSWDTPVVDILGEEFRFQDDFRTQEASIRDMFSHKLGMPSYWGVSTAAMNLTRKEIVMDRIEHFPVLYPFRRQYLYSNYLYLIGSYVTRILTGQPWEDYIKGTIFGPLGMTDSRVSRDMDDAEWQNNVAFSYTHTNGTYTVNPEQDQMPFLNEIAPAAGVFTTADDMAKWMIFQLNEGKDSEGEEIISSAELLETHKASTVMGRESPRIQRPRFPVDDMRLTYAMGWRNGMYRGYEKLQHSGAYSSYDCHLRLLPDMEIGVCACVNSPGDSRASNAVTVTTAYALDLLLDEEPWLNETTGCTYPQPWSVQSDPLQVTFPQRRTKPPHRSLQDYVGVYSHEAFGDFTVTYNAENEQLEYKFGVLLSGKLVPADDPDDFYMTLNHPLTYRMAFFPQYPHGFPLYFGSLEDGTIVSVTVPYLESSLPPTFDKY